MAITGYALVSWKANSCAPRERHCADTSAMAGGLLVARRLPWRPPYTGER